MSKFQSKPKSGAAAPAPPVTAVQVGPYKVCDSKITYGSFDMTEALAALSQTPLTPDQLVRLARLLKPLAISRNQLTPRSQLVLKLAVGEIIAAGLQPS